MQSAKCKIIIFHGGLIFVDLVYATNSSPHEKSYVREQMPERPNPRNYVLTKMSFLLNNIISYDRIEFLIFVWL